ncbi:MAG: MBL fold metallo-hydrolase [Labilithrix sp.]|nr:MBL fold metallo-hydrolase [Labilithrix sp.]
MKQKLGQGLVDLGNGAWGWIAHSGSWGWSNAGLIADHEASLLVDTLFDLPLTAQMLKAMRDAEPRAKKIATVVNTHANGDHCHGNQLIEGAEIIATHASAEEMEEVTPELLAEIMRDAREDPTDAGRFLRYCFDAFDFEGIRHTPPTRTFERELTVKVGDKDVHLIEVGPAHTKGDMLVHVPADRVVFTGDILFIGGTPIMWAGPVQRWIDACRRIEAMDVDYVVPGHGPIVDRAGAGLVRGYLEYVRDEAKVRYDAGMSAFDAARDIPLKEYAEWTDSERIVVTVDRLYAELSGRPSSSSVLDLFARMADVFDFE